MEVQDWIDAINHPEWQRESRTIFGPNSPTYTLEADYVFSTMG
jgi:aldose 1-epimerase